MKSFMTRLSDFLTRRRWFVLAAWVAVVVLTLPLAAKQTEHLVGGGFEVSDSGSQIVEQAIEEDFEPGQSGGLGAVLDGRDATSAQQRGRGRAGGVRSPPMGIFDFLKRNDEKAIPETGTPEFDAAVQGSAIPDSQSVEMGQSGWTNPSSAEEALKQLGIDPSQAEVIQESQTIDLRGTGAREQVEKVLREKGIDPDQKGQTIDASTVPGLQEAIFSALGDAGIQIPGAGGFGGGVSPPQADPLAQVEHLASKRDAGEITDAEFEAQKRRLLGS